MAVKGGDESVQAGARANGPRLMRQMSLTFAETNHCLQLEIDCLGGKEKEARRLVAGEAGNNLGYASERGPSGR